VDKNNSKELHTFLDPSLFKKEKKATAASKGKSPSKQKSVKNNHTICNSATRVSKSKNTTSVQQQTMIKDPFKVVKEESCPSMAQMTWDFLHDPFLEHLDTSLFSEEREDNRTSLADIVNSVLTDYSRFNHRIL
jgi:hypothetical protein